METLQEKLKINLGKIDFLIEKFMSTILAKVTFPVWYRHWWKENN